MTVAGLTAINKFPYIKSIWLAREMKDRYVELEPLRLTLPFSVMHFRLLVLGATEGS